MKVLIIIGSPKGKGDGFKVTKKIEESMKELGDVEFNYLFLKNTNLELCQGCFICVSKGENLCPLKDDRSKIEEQIENSDGIIIVSPTYVQNVSWLMKNFIDRFAYTHHRPRFFNQKVMLIANGGAGMKNTLKALRNTFGGPEVVHKLAYMTPPWPLSDKVNTKQQKTLDDAAKKFYNILSKKEAHSPSIMEIMKFRFFKNTIESTKRYLPADYEYYKDKHNYYYDTKINGLKNIIAKSMTRFILFLMRNMGPKNE